ncbi:hypothetical protein SDC9_118821 [bioreactor metagenome]|uniref:Uncharacterized protein n=1 Tax=bioreactor metagenome TaxID=1076179 RepID=A0A645C255_9ZZZZ
MMHCVRFCSSFATAVSGPPAICTPNPKRTAATIRGSMALRLHSSGKSGFVKKFTIISPTATVFVSPAVSAYVPVTTGNIRTTTYMSTAAIAAVVRKVTMVVPMIFPARFKFCMLAMAELMETKTIGTTTQNMALMKRVPSGSSLFAPGQTAPTAQPPMMAMSIDRINP